MGIGLGLCLIFGGIGNKGRGLRWGALHPVLTRDWGRVAPQTPRGYFRPKKIAVPLGVSQSLDQPDGNCDHDDRDCNIETAPHFW